MSASEGVREPALTSRKFRTARGDATHLAACAALEAASFGAPWTMEMLREELGRASLLLVARELHALPIPGAESVAADDVVAYALLRVVPPDAEILRLAVNPRSRRQGAGAELVTAAIAELRRHGCERLWLEVRSDNDAALGLYRRLGFELVATRRRYYDDGTDARLLRLTWERAPTTPAGPG